VNPRGGVAAPWHPMLVAAAMTALGSLPVFLLSAQSVLVREDLQFDEPQLGLAVGVFFGAAALSSLTSGKLADRFGRRTSTIAAGTLATAGTAGVAVGAVSFPVLLALFVVCGVANSALQTTANLILARSVPRRRQGLAFGVKQSAVPVATLLGGLAVPTIGVVVGWRWTYAVATVAAVLVVLTGLAAPRRPPVERTVRHRGEGAPAGALIITGAAATLASAAVNSLGAFLPAWAFDVGLTPGDAGLLLAAASALCVLARIASGIAADRRGGRHLPVVSAQLIVGAVGLVLLSLGSVPMLLAGALVAFAIGWSWPGVLLFSIVRVGRDNPARAASAVQVGAFTGGAGGPVLFGVLVAATDYPTAWRAAAVALLVAAGLLLVARRMFLTDLVQRPPRQALDAVGLAS
jgi:MFS family permease